MVSIDLKKAIAVEGAQDLAQQNANADAKLAEAEAALAEAKRLKKEAEEKLARMQENSTGEVTEKDTNE